MPRMRKVVLTVELETSLPIRELRNVRAMEFGTNGGVSYVYKDENADGHTYGKIEQVQANVVKK